MPSESVNATQIYAHHNFFKDCPPDSFNVYPVADWDLSNCHEIEYVKYDPIISSNNFHISPVYPNPFNPITTIPISIIESGVLDVSIYDLRGNLVEKWNTFITTGNHNLTWDARNQPSGIYFIKANFNEFYESQKAILIK